MFRNILSYNVILTVSRTVKEELKFDHSKVTSHDRQGYPILGGFFEPRRLLLLQMLLLAGLLLACFDLIASAKVIAGRWDLIDFDDPKHHQIALWHESRD